MNITFFSQDFWAVNFHPQLVSFAIPLSVPVIALVNEVNVSIWGKSVGENQEV